MTSRGALKALKAVPFANGTLLKSRSSVLAAGWPCSCVLCISTWSSSSSSDSQRADSIKPWDMVLLKDRKRMKGRGN